MKKYKIEFEEVVERVVYVTALDAQDAVDKLDNPDEWSNSYSSIGDYQNIDIEVVDE